MAGEFIFFLDELRLPMDYFISKESIIRYLWTKKFYQYIFKNAVAIAQYDAMLM